MLKSAVVGYSNCIPDDKLQSGSNNNMRLYVAPFLDCAASVLSLPKDWEYVKEMAA